MKIIDNFIHKIGMLTLSDLKEIQQNRLATEVVLANIESIGSTSTGNPYKNYETAIVELSKKYEGIADWGNFQARSVIDVRSAFIIGNGLKVVERDPDTKKNIPLSTGKFKAETDYIEQFIQRNDLDEEGAQVYAKEAEIEGRALFRLFPDKDSEQIDLRFMSWNTNRYKVIPDPEDYKVYKEVTYKKPNTAEPVKLNKGTFIYKRFAGRADKINDIMPKVATVMRLFEDLDKALKDLRIINNLFASPTPHFNCEDETAATNMYKKLKDINWKIGKFIVTSKTQLTLVGADPKGIQGITEEITNYVKMISGLTGIPVHFLGLPELMSNRSVSTDMFEMIIASTNGERKTWIGAYEEIFKNVLSMSNEKFGTAFNSDAVGCEIPRVTAAKLKELSEIWLPLFMANVVDLDFMLSMIPEADPESIKASALDAAKQQLELMKATEKPEEDEDEE